MGSGDRFEQKLNLAMRKLDASKLDERATQAATWWRQYRELPNAGGLADFARQLDNTVPSEFDEYWDHPMYQHISYSLARAGAQPMFPDQLERKTSRRRPKAHTQKGSAEKS
jgi:hypothetical protein